MDASIVTIHPQRAPTSEAERRARLCDRAEHRLRFMATEADRYGALSSAQIDATVRLLRHTLDALREVRS